MFLNDCCPYIHKPMHKYTCGQKRFGQGLGGHGGGRVDRPEGSPWQQAGVDRLAKMILSIILAFLPKPPGKENPAVMVPELSWSIKLKSVLASSTVQSRACKYNLAGYLSGT